MQLSHNFSGLALFILALTSVGMTTPLAASSENEAVTGTADEPAMYRVVSHEQMMHWIANTDAELTFIGKPINPLAPHSAQHTIVIYCKKLVNTFHCELEGECTVYNGGATCLKAPGTRCLAATTNNVEFCYHSECGHDSCRQLSTCPDTLRNSFCKFPPGTLTQSIRVPAA